ncbi:FecCD family ABC transporter permease [Vibrio sp. WXL210]|uniref:FecCD family ABC transporter permease n=1 Tax=Vibrio sp. WXL210 TaxID=3450709 RepID=UPI003EC7BCF9
MNHWVKQKGTSPRLLFIGMMPVIAIILALGVGRMSIPPSYLAARVFIASDVGLDPTFEAVLWQIRWPRVMAAMLVGGALALSGACFQGLFHNPMVSPDLLGASAGASLGACVGILLSLDYLSMQLMAFAGGLIAVSTCYLLSRWLSRGAYSKLLIVLTGMMITSLLSAFISLTKYLADPYSKLPEITFWLMGSLTAVDMSALELSLFPLLLGALPILLLRWPLDALSCGDEEAKALGLPVNKLRLIYILCATLLTSASVSLAGMIGWVGLLVPHLTRMLVGPSHLLLIPSSILLGGCFLLAVDTLSRSLFSVELPLGILTAIVGAPFFFYLMFTGQRV